MNPSTALAAAIVDELVLGGVHEAVLSPGSRNAPLSYALHDADRRGRLRLHVRIDERTAAFLALGLAKASGQPVIVVTTSGTAAVNLHPAIVEADYAAVPVIALTADRPVEMRGTGANQTIDQTELYGGSVRAFLELSVDTAPTEVLQRAAIRSALASARGSGSAEGTARTAPWGGGSGGPVHVNVALREPLVPDGGPSERESLSLPPGQSAHASGVSTGRGVPSGSSQAEPADELMAKSEPPLEPGGQDVARPLRELRGGPARTVVVAGDGAGAAARELAEAQGWPLLAEPSSGARNGPNAMTAYRLYVDALADHVERVIVYGRPTLSRPVARLLARADVTVIRAAALDTERSAHSAGENVGDSSDAAGFVTGKPGEWLRHWQDVDAAARRGIAAVLATGPLSGLAAAAAVMTALPAGALLVAGSSSAVRDLDLAPLWDTSGNTTSTHPAEQARTPRVLANRGASGIDGTVSTAIGAALAHQRPDPARTDAAEAPAYALMGDLTFLHDANGLVIGPDEPRPDLTIVVVNDDGGGLFSLLEQGELDGQGAFERVFGTPHHVDLAALCAASRTRHVVAETLEELRQHVVTQPDGIRVIEVRTDRSRTREFHARLSEAVAVAVSALAS